MRRSVSLIPPLGEAISVIGQPIRAAGWYGPTIGLHTAAIRVLNFQGRIGLQASLATTPHEADWFSVLPEKVAYWQYPRALVPLAYPLLGETSTVGFNFLSNALWLRATVDRSYLSPLNVSPLDVAGWGTVDLILVNY